MTIAKPFKPMLAATCEDQASIKFPVLASPKLDGIRAITTGGSIVSRNLKPIPNRFVQEVLGALPAGLDGELIVGMHRGKNVWNHTSSGVMKADGEPNFRFHVFDYLDELVPCNEGFEDRLFEAVRLVGSINDRWGRLKMVPHYHIADIEDLGVLERHAVNAGYEGIMVRSLDGTYKFGRSTVKEGGLMKIQRRHDGEFPVCGFTELQHNDDVATKDELGRTKRSSAKAGKHGASTLGTLVLRTKDNKIFEVGTGFTTGQRAELWAIREDLVEQRTRVTVKYQEMTEAGVPRFPVFLRIRETADLAAAE